MGAMPASGRRDKVEWSVIVSTTLRECVPTDSDEGSESAGTAVSAFLEPKGSGPKDSGLKVSFDGSLEK
jgi:hypothetical protein